MKNSFNFFLKISILLLIFNNILSEKNEKNSNKKLKDLQIEEDFIGKIYYRLGILNKNLKFF